MMHILSYDTEKLSKENIAYSPLNSSKQGSLCSQDILQYSNTTFPSKHKLYVNKVLDMLMNDSIGFNPIKNVGELSWQDRIFLTLIHCISHQKYNLVGI